MWICPYLYSKSKIFWHLTSTQSKSMWLPAIVSPIINMIVELRDLTIQSSCTCFEEEGGVGDNIDQSINTSRRRHALKTYPTVSPISTSRIDEGLCAFCSSAFSWDLDERDTWGWLKSNLLRPEYESRGKAQERGDVERVWGKAVTKVKPIKLHAYVLVQCF